MITLHRTPQISSYTQYHIQAFTVTLCILQPKNHRIAEAGRHSPAQSPGSV